MEPVLCRNLHRAHPADSGPGLATSGGVTMRRAFLVLFLVLWGSLHSDAAAPPVHLAEQARQKQLQAKLDAAASTGEFETALRHARELLQARKRWPGEQHWQTKSA